MNHLSVARTSTKHFAVVRQSGKVILNQMPAHKIQTGQVVIDVHAVGICRTDLFAARGTIPTKPDPLVLGHEFAGVVAAVASDVTTLTPGDHVAINPVISCGSCESCHDEQPHLCSKVMFMGVDFDGAMRESIVVDEQLAYQVPIDLPFEVAAFAEPVAATLGIFNAAITPNQKGLLIGDSRITTLAARVLSAQGFHNITVATLAETMGFSDSLFDFVIETSATTDTIREMARVVVSNGRLILKSRQEKPFEICLREIVAKQPIIEVVHYGRFDEAVDLLVTGRVKVDDLIGKNFALRDFQRALNHASEDQTQKTFINPRGN